MNNRIPRYPLAEAPEPMVRPARELNQRSIIDDRCPSNSAHSDRGFFFRGLRCPVAGEFRSLRGQLDHGGPTASLRCRAALHVKYITAASFSPVEHRRLDIPFVERLGEAASFALRSNGPFNRSQ